MRGAIAVLTFSLGCRGGHNLKEYRQYKDLDTGDLDEHGKVISDNLQLPTVTVYYDYKPSDFEDPVLLYFKG